ncbi:DsbC/DsbD-like thiol-disulfide interchange protein [Paenibacillus sp. 1182]|uniref:hypothetical protein n=1 Tax=Paenibacillus sp. 1182 TaxID=2806565 RepID=UPI001AEB1303|nr:hypothetical protein [Paenibacillus sp. 1182]MBP1308797.1 DsbC/DsbD-like thiol-disulfide interchange protein [Paenibacillus sp. 1182]
MTNKLTVKRVLVQGSAEFRINCDDLRALVTPEQAADEKYMQEFFRTEAYRILASGHSSDSQAEYENDVPVLVSEETAAKHTGKIISTTLWSDIIEDNILKNKDEV